jgi:hypothetical protein
MEESPSEITIPIANAASTVLGTPVEALPPISESISLDALNELVSDDTSADVTFTSAGLHVLVHSGGTVYVRPTEDEMDRRPLSIASEESD